MANITCLRLDTGQFYQANGVMTIPWVNGPYQPGQEVTYKILRVSLWGGMTIGANMDFAAGLYVTGQGWFYQPQGAGNITPLAYMALDRYGTSNGQNYQIDKDWDRYDICVNPMEQVILQSFCVNHGPQTPGGANPVFGWPASADNAHAQAYIWMESIT